MPQVHAEVSRTPAATARPSTLGNLGSTVDEVVDRPGESLDIGTRDYFEARLGWDFGRVRVHADDRAAGSALAMGSRAYAIGGAVVFGQDEYRPRSPGGRDLLAHELAHVVEQSSGAAPADQVQCQPATIDWQAIADRMTLSELSAAVGRLRAQADAGPEASAVGLSNVQQLRAFEEALAARRAPLDAEAQAVAAARQEQRGAGLVGGVFERGTTADALFASGFLAGCTAAVPPAELTAFESQLRERFPEFYGGYLAGLPVGLWHGLTGTVQGLFMLAQAAYLLTPQGMRDAAVRMGIAILSDPAGWLAARRAEYEIVKAIAEALTAMGKEYQADPTVAFEWSSEAGIAVGNEAGNLLTKEFFRKSVYDKGNVVGDFVGQIVFEIVMELVLAACTEGVGNLIRGLGAVGQGARATGKLGTLIRAGLEAWPAFRRVLRIAGGHLDEAAEVTHAVTEAVDVAEDLADVAGVERVAEKVHAPGGGGAPPGGGQPPAAAGAGAPPPRRPGPTIYEGEAGIHRPAPGPAAVGTPAVPGVTPDVSVAPRVAARGEEVGRRLESLLGRLEGHGLDLEDVTGIPEEGFLGALDELPEDEALRLLRQAEDKLDTHPSLTEGAARGAGTDPELARAAAEAMSPLDAPKGEPPLANEVKGVSAELRHAREVVSKDPELANRLRPPRILADMREALRKGVPGALRRFAEAFPAEGVRQVFLPIGTGGRIIDHMYIDGARVVLRESKDVKVFRLTKKYLRQLRKDLEALRRYPEARVEWRITGDVDVDAMDYLNQLVKDFPDGFSYRLDGPSSFSQGRFVPAPDVPVVPRRR